MDHIELINKVKEQADLLYRKDYSFYHIDRLIRLLNFQNEHNSCQKCMGSYKKFKTKGIELKALLDTREGRTWYENWLDSGINHLKKEHQIYPAFHFSYLFSFYGMIAGIVLSAFVYLFYPVLKVVLLIFVLALSVGYFIGSRKDNYYRFKKKII